MAISAAAFEFLLLSQLYWMLAILGFIVAVIIGLLIS